MLRGVEMVLPGLVEAPSTRGAGLRLPAAIAQLLSARGEAPRLGPFVLVEQLGRGGFAPVWLAREVYGSTTLRTAAVKLFALPQAGGTLERERIIAEARSLCRVEHPNVVRFYALPLDEGGTVMGLAMEHVAGTPLDRRLAEEGPLSVPDVLTVGAAIASALAAVHRTGLVHRDVKPSNIIQAAGTYKLIDFGIAGLDGGEIAFDESEGSESTQRVAVHVGTLGYMDPECVREPVPAEPASDLYALGATLFSCLTGQLPGSDGNGGLQSAVLEGRERAPTVARLAPRTPPALAELIDQLIAPSRAERPPSSEWVAIRFEQIRAELAGLERVLPPESIGPFRGLARFEASDRGVYFGRSSEVAAALETLRGRGVVALLGPSGSGKSSLARAGLLPAIADGALGAWPPVWSTAVAAPGKDPKRSVIEVLAAQVSGLESLTPANLVRRLSERAHEAGEGTVLFIDQLEELATLSLPESVAFVVELLHEIGARPLPGVRAVVAARRDLLDPLLGLGELGKILLRGSVLVEPLPDSLWAEVIDRGLTAYGYSFEDAELREHVLTDLARAFEAMPLVQFALSELWSKRDTLHKCLTRESLAETGGLLGALGRHADRALAELLERSEIPQDAPRAVLLALTTASGTRATRSLAELERVAGPAASRVLAALESERLVVAQSGGVTLAHDALISSWPLLSGWVAEAREQRLLAEELERIARVYHGDPEHTPLWRRTRLEDGERLVESGFRLSDEALAFLGASWGNERRRLFILFGSAGLVLTVLASFVIAYLRAVSIEQSKTAAALRDERTSRKLAERRTREVQAAQARVDELLRSLAASPKKDEILALQRQIRRDLPAPRATIVEATRPRTAPSAALSTSPPSDAPAPPPALPAVKIQKDW